jgi:hypothetical protein
MLNIMTHLFSVGQAQSQNGEDELAKLRAENEALRAALAARDSSNPDDKDRVRVKRNSIGVMQFYFYKIEDWMMNLQSKHWENVELPRVDGVLITDKIRYEMSEWGS